MSTNSKIRARLQTEGITGETDTDKNAEKLATLVSLSVSGVG